MEVSELGVGSGEWLAANCGSLPSENNCKLVIIGPANQREDLLDAAVAHAVQTHGHADTPQLRSDVNGLLESVSV